MPLGREGREREGGKEEAWRQEGERKGKKRRRRETKRVEGERLEEKGDLVPFMSLSSQQERAEARAGLTSWAVPGKMGICP